MKTHWISSLHFLWAVLATTIWWVDGNCQMSVPDENNLISKKFNLDARFGVDEVIPTAGGGYLTLTAVHRSYRDRPERNDFTYRNYRVLSIKKFNHKLEFLERNNLNLVYGKAKLDYHSLVKMRTGYMLFMTYENVRKNRVFLFAAKFDTDQLKTVSDPVMICSEARQAKNQTKPQFKIETSADGQVIAILSIPPQILDYGKVIIENRRKIKNEDDLMKNASSGAINYFEVNLWAYDINLKLLNYRDRFQFKLRNRPGTRYSLNKMLVDGEGNVFTMGRNGITIPQVYGLRHLKNTWSDYSTGFFIQKIYVQKFETSGKDFSFSPDLSDSIIDGTITFHPNGQSVDLIGIAGGQKEVLMRIDGLVHLRLDRDDLSLQSRESYISSAVNMKPEANNKVDREEEDLKTPLKKYSNAFDSASNNVYKGSLPKFDPLPRNHLYPDSGSGSQGTDTIGYTLAIPKTSVSSGFGNNTPKSFMTRPSLETPDSVIRYKRGAVANIDSSDLESYITQIILSNGKVVEILVDNRMANKKIKATNKFMGFNKADLFFIDEVHYDQGGYPVVLATSWYFGRISADTSTEGYSLNGGHVNAIKLKPTGEFETLELIGYNEMSGYGLRKGYSTVYADNSLFFASRSYIWELHLDKLSMVSFYDPTPDLWRTGAYYNLGEISTFTEKLRFLDMKIYSFRDYNNQNENRVNGRFVFIQYLDHGEARLQEVRLE